MDSSQLIYTVPLLSGFTYGVAALFVKRTFMLGFGFARFMFFCNLMFAVTMAPVLFWNDVPWSAMEYFWPMVAGSTFFLAQLLTFLAIRIGDVTIQTPVMGTKALFVATFTIILDAGPVPWHWWLGAAMIATAIVLIGYTPRRVSQSGLRGLGLAIVSASCFGLTDVLIQREGSQASPLLFAFVMMVTSAILSMLLIPFFRSKLSSIPKPAWKFGTLAAVLLSLQSHGITLVVAFFGKATMVNILYGSRGMWSVVLVLLMGKLFGSTEGLAGPAAMTRRLAGSLLICAAIFFVLSD